MRFHFWRAPFALGALAALVCVAVATSGPALARPHGDHIGNGSFAAQRNIIYAYLILPDAIGACLENTEVCGTTPSENVLLQRIFAIAVDYPASSDRIRFCQSSAAPAEPNQTVLGGQVTVAQESEQDLDPNSDSNVCSFSLGDDQPESTDSSGAPRANLPEFGNADRFARTSLRAGAPTFWNGRQLIDADGNPRHSLSALISYWTHELGHQARVSGRSSHFELDVLGSKVAKNFASLENRRNVLSSLIAADSRLVLYDVLRSVPGERVRYDQRSEVYFQNGLGTVRLTSTVDRLAVCGAGERRVGWTIQNPYWADDSLEEFSPGLVRHRLRISGLVRCEAGSVVDAARPEQIDMRTSVERLQFDFFLVYQSLGAGIYRPVRFEALTGPDRTESSETIAIAPDPE